MAKVLLATDPGPPRTRGLLRVFLESAGHQVSEVDDGAAALAALSAVQPEVLIVDTALPTLDGFQVLARMQHQPSAPKPPVLVISTIPAPLGSQLVYTLGATAYLHKPFTFQALSEKIDQVLAPPANGAAARDPAVRPRVPGAAVSARRHALSARTKPPRRGTRQRRTG